jgi:hypothetical protein
MKHLTSVTRLANQLKIDRQLVFQKIADAGIEIEMVLDDEHFLQSVDAARLLSEGK